MKKLLPVTAIAVAVTLLALPLAYGQEKAAPQQAEKVFEGQLTNVDTAAKTITVKGTGNSEMKFTYTDRTQVVGQEKNIQGLAGKTGTDLKVTYRAAGENNTATKIEVVEKQERR